MFYSKKHTPGVTHQSPRSDSHRHRRTNLRTHAGTNRRPHNPRVTRNHRLHAGAPQLGEHLQEILQAWIKHLRSCDGLRGRRDAGCHGTSFRPVVWVPRVGSLYTQSCKWVMKTGQAADAKHPEKATNLSYSPDGIGSGESMVNRRSQTIARLPSPLPTSSTSLPVITKKATGRHITPCDHQKGNRQASFAPKRTKHSEPCSSLRRPRKSRTSCWSCPPRRSI